MAQKRKQQNSPDTGRFQTTLTQELVDELCTVHADGKDFRNVTAVRCGVHPALLSRWLKRGATEEGGLYAQLFMRLTRVEGEVRAKWIAELENTQSLVEHTEYDDGKPISKTSEARRTNGIQWLMERRFRQFRADYVLRDDERDAAEYLVPQQAGMTGDMVIAVLSQIAAEPWRLPEHVRKMFAAVDWAAATSARQLETTDGPSKQAH